MCYFFCIFVEIIFCKSAQQKHAFNQPRCMYFSALPPRTPCVCIFWSFVMWMKALLCTIPPNTKFTGKTNHSYTTTKQLEKRFWLCQKFRGQLFVPEPVVRRKGEKSINALAPLLLGAVAIFRMFVSTFYNGTILVTFSAKGTLVEFQVTTNLPLFSFHILPLHLNFECFCLFGDYMTRLVIEIFFHNWSQIKYFLIGTYLIKQINWK